MSKRSEEIAARGQRQMVRSANRDAWREFSWAAGDGVADLTLEWCMLGDRPEELIAQAESVCILAAPDNRHALCEWLRGQMRDSLKLIFKERYGIVAWAEKARFIALEKNDRVGLSWGADGELSAYISHVRILTELTDGESHNINMRDE